MDLRIDFLCGIFLNKRLEGFKNNDSLKNILQKEKIRING